MTINAAITSFEAFIFPSSFLLEIWIVVVVDGGS